MARPDPADMRVSSMTGIAAIKGGLPPLPTHRICPDPAAHHAHQNPDGTRCLGALAPEDRQWLQRMHGGQR